jgi:glutamate/tyrosine decarboxylase-like PLP-dependent enzyme
VSRNFESDRLKKIRNYDLRKDLDIAKEYAWEYLNNIHKRSVYPNQVDIDNIQEFSEELNEEPSSPTEIIKKLHKYGSPATVAQNSGRYFGFVCGAMLPSSIPAKWLADVWDQNPAIYVMSPTVSKIESIVEGWLIDLFKFNKECTIGYVGGSATATFAGLVTARNYLLSKKGYDPFNRGITDLPKVKVVVGEGVHSTVFKALSLSGMGYDNVIRVPMDQEGRMIFSELPELDDMTIVVAQAGHLSTGAFDPIKEICEKAQKAGAWVHVDGAFGLWARVDKRFNHLTVGLELADSWSVDGHKTLNAPYDNGMIICKHSKLLLDAMNVEGSYIIRSKFRDGMLFTPEMSRRARVIDLWSSLKGLGKNGLGDMIYEMHAKAKYFAQRLNDLGFEIMNEIHFNQIIVHYSSNDETLKLIELIQKSGVMWLGGSKWQGKNIIRISISSYKTTYEDIDMCIDDFESQMMQLLFSGNQNV